ncbi:MAG: hypothetical protein VZR11_09490 [Succinimonas sp.]|jgi:hypothetical protein|nr:hypothetical protein [Succinimonas sp.]
MKTALPQNDDMTGAASAEMSTQKTAGISMPETLSQIHFQITGLRRAGVLA